MDVGCAQLHGALEQVVDGAHHRGAARKVAQAFDVIVGARRSSFLAVGRGFVVLAETLGQDGCNVLVRADFDFDRPAEHDFGGAHGGLIGRVREHQPAASGGTLIGEDQGLAQEAAGEFGGQGLGGDQLRQRDPGQSIEGRHLLGEVIRREVARFVKVSQGLVVGTPATGIEFRQ